ncbi:MAG: glycosyltransferase family 2 protein [Spirirestis rafaelensis WJT71-NPBG6]|nr:glycosyltransferase family 2 protein [Spirirestis rafaelensis WJT71-NPBG6]
MNKPHLNRATIQPVANETPRPLFIEVAARWFWRKLRTAISLCQNPAKIMKLYIRPLILKTTIKHIYGLDKINYTIDELIVLCVVRNGELYIKSFIEHYLSLGVKHIVFLDNNSTDNTIEIARNYDKVTILQTKCPYRKYETVMKHYLVNRFSKNRWNIFSDIDELFDYPFSDVISLSSLLTYLNNNSYTAVVAQMLDLFSAKSLASLKSQKDDSLKDIYTYYDIFNIQKERYPYGTASNKNVKWHWGGIRKTLFGSNNYLTKAALVFVDKKINLFVNCHQVNNAYIADFTCVLLHYPFLSSFYDKVKDAVKTDRYAMSASYEYEMYWKRLEEDPDLNLKQETACLLENVNTLVENDFLVVSEKYMQWIKTNTKTNLNDKTIT